MGYLITSDFNRSIQDVSLQQVISGNTALMVNAELVAIAEVTSYLRQKYDIDKEFTNTQQYNPQATYNAADRVYLDATAYSPASLYALGLLTLQAGKVYQCSTAIVAIEPFTEAHWTLLGNQYDIFYTKYPFPVFNLVGYYRKGDKVFWKNHTYTALQASRQYDHDSLIQFVNTDSIPYRNTFPDDPDSGSKYWTDEGAYVVPAGSLLNATYFIKGDNRNQQMLQYIMDIALYHMYARIAPKNIPEVRTDRYNAAVIWLQMSAKGQITADLTKIQPAQGGRIRFGSNIKQQNSY